MIPQKWGEAPNPQCYLNDSPVNYQFEAKSWKVAFDMVLTILLKLNEENMWLKISSANSPLFVSTLYFGYAGVNQKMSRTLLERANITKEVLLHSRFTSSMEKGQLPHLGSGILKIEKI